MVSQRDLRSFINSMTNLSARPNNSINSFTSFAGRIHVGSLASLAILAHVFVPQSWVLAV